MHHKHNRISICLFVKRICHRRRSKSGTSQPIFTTSHRCCCCYCCLHSTQYPHSHKMYCSFTARHMALWSLLLHTHTHITVALSLSFSVFHFHFYGERRSFVAHYSKSSKYDIFDNVRHHKIECIRIIRIGWSREKCVAVGKLSANKSRNWGANDSAQNGDFSLCWAVYWL